MGGVALFAHHGFLLQKSGKEFHAKEVGDGDRRRRAEVKVFGGGGRKPTKPSGGSAQGGKKCPLFDDRTPKIGTFRKLPFSRFFN